MTRRMWIAVGLLAVILVGVCVAAYVFSDSPEEVALRNDIIASADTNEPIIAEAAIAHGSPLVGQSEAQSYVRRLEAIKQGKPQPFGQELDSYSALTSRIIWDINDHKEVEIRKARKAEKLDSKQLKELVKESLKDHPIMVVAEAHEYLKAIKKLRIQHDWDYEKKREKFDEWKKVLDEKMLAIHKTMAK